MPTQGMPLQVNVCIRENVDFSIVEIPLILINS